MILEFRVQSILVMV